MVESTDMIRVDGQVRAPRDFAFADLASLPGQIADVAALVPGREGGAVALRSVLDAVGPSSAATRVTLESSDGKFSQQAPLAALQSAVLVYRLGELPLPAEKGGPVRFLIPNLEECNVGGVDRCTNVKALARVRLE
jgi:DMSO/TMAO reductase YedYZ molybdopterin-dependent catalytic subunit